MAKNYLPNTFYLRQILNYDLETGNLYWKINKSPTAMAGMIAGADSHGYVSIKIDGIFYGAHRIIWKIYYGMDPLNLIDHVNGNKKDNRIFNLREANFSQNAANCKSSNKFKLKGVRQMHKANKYESYININRRYKYLGAFDTKEEANDAYWKEAIKLHGEYARKS